MTAPGASPANVEPAEAGSSKLVDWNIESTISWLRESQLPGIEQHVFESMEEWAVDGATLMELCTAAGDDAMQSLESMGIDILLLIARNPWPAYLRLAAVLAPALLNFTR